MMSPYILRNLLLAAGPTNAITPAVTAYPASGILNRGLKLSGRRFRAVQTIGLVIAGLEPLPLPEDMEALPS